MYLWIPSKKKNNFQLLKTVFLFFRQEKGHLHVGQVWVFHDFVSWWVDGSHPGPRGGDDRVSPKTGGIIGGWQGTNLLPQKMFFFVSCVVFWVVATQICFLLIFTPKIGEDSRVDYVVFFKRGWNHQLVFGIQDIRWFAFIFLPWHDIQYC